MVSTVYAAAPIASEQHVAGVVQLQEMVQRVTSLSIGIAFIAILFMLFWGGIKYLTSGGDSKSVEEANRTVTWALLGVLFLVVAFLVLRVVTVFTGVDVLHFCIGFPGAGTGCG